MGYVMPLQLVVLLRIETCVVHDLVVAEPARVERTLAYLVRALELALPQVVFAPEVFLVDSIAVLHILDLFLLALASLAAVLMPWPHYFRLLLHFTLEC